MKKKSTLFTGIMMLFYTALIMQVFANTTLTVNCGTVLRGVTHCASGSLYGVTESKPSDITGLVAPLNPCVFTNPARAGAGYQQPIGAAIPVAGRLAGTTGRVIIRLADVFPNWPYAFTNMSDWLNKVTSVINDKKASGYSNFYGYEIWNEPGGTWNKGNGDFNSVLWKQTYDRIRSLDPGAPIIGPSYSYYRANDMSTFLNYAKNNNCLPDIICWHELGGPANIANNINTYRSLESSLGISARKISINEYCDSDHYLEGQPGSSARFMGKFERFKVDSACISWWFTGAPGRLGSLLANDNGGKGAGWYFYKWYGDMSGNMVSTTAPRENSTNMDGCASIDGNTLTVLFGGPNDGTCTVNINGLPSGFGSTVNVLVQRVDWSSKDTVCSGIVTVSQSNYNVSGGSISVTVSGTNGSSGYRVYITGSGGPTPTPTGTPPPTPTPNQNPIWSGGPYTLNGTSDYVDVPDRLTNNLYDFSIACWVNLNALTNWARIFDFGNDTNVYMMLTPSSGNTGYPYFCITTSSNSGEQGINGTSTFPTGSWQHLAVVKSGNTGILYINNQEVGRNSGITLRPADMGNTTNNYIGRSQWSNDPYLNAGIDHFVVYNRGISASEVSTLFNDKPGGSITPGDVNDSGTIDIVDALMIAQYYVGLNPPGFNAANADVNCDGSVTIVDALMVAQYYVGLITSLSCS